MRFSIGSYFARLVLFQNYHKLLVSQGMDDFKMLINALTGTRSGRILKYLEICCESDGQPIVANQAMIAELLVRDNASMFLEVQITDEDLTLSDPTGVLQAVSVTQLLQQEGDSAFFEASSDKRIQIYVYHEGLMTLLGKLVMGRNEHTTELVRANAERFGVSLDQLSRLIAHDGVPYILRATYCSLIVRLYIDVEPNLETFMFQETRMWSKIVSGQPPPGQHRQEDAQQQEAAADASEVPGGSAHNALSKHFDVAEAAARLSSFDWLKDVVVGLIKKHSQTDCDKQSRNRFVMELIVMVQELTKFAFFHKMDMSTMLPGR